MIYTINRRTTALLVRILPALMVTISLTGCGGGGSVAAPNVSVTVTPGSASLPIMGTQQFTANVATNANSTNQAVSWKVNEGASGGTITQAGLYTAPASVGTYHVTATSKANTTKASTASVTVHTIVAVTPGTVTVLAGQTQTFVATVQGSSNTAVTWSVIEGAAGGTISANGVYTAPSVPGVYHVTATSAVDNVTAQQATVTVQGGNVQGTIQ